MMGEQLNLNGGCLIKGRLCLTFAFPSTSGHTIYDGFHHDYIDLFISLARFFIIVHLDLLTGFIDSLLLLVRLKLIFSLYTVGYKSETAS